MLSNIYALHRNSDAVNRLDDAEGLRGAARKLAKELSDVKLQRSAAVDEVRGLKRKIAKCSSVVAFEKERAKVKKLQGQKKNEHEKWRYQKAQAESAKGRILSDGDGEELRTEIEQVGGLVEDLRKDNRDLLNDLDEKQEEIVALKERLEESQEVVTFSGREYTTEFTELVWKHLADNVAFDKVSRRIADDWAFLGRKATKLPTENKISEMNISRLAASQQQVQVDLCTIYVAIFLKSVSTQCSARFQNLF